MDTNQLTALLQLTSPAFPIGGFSYSQGFETAVELKVVTDETSAYHWISHQLSLITAHCEAPIWLLLFEAWEAKQYSDVAYWNEWFHASRETRELQLETEQMGWSLTKLASDLNWGKQNLKTCLAEDTIITLPAAHAFCIHVLGISKINGLTAYLFTWLENQVMAAIKTVPLGQMAGQHLLNQARQLVPAVIQEALDRSAQQPPRIHSLASQFAILSSRHESQYSRLFRS